VRLGRPRDGALDKKVIDAAIHCYAERGWSGFNFEAVSVKASVGRRALYLRWSSREELLIDAFRESTRPLRVGTHGHVRDDLIEIALAHRQLLAGPRGRAGWRLAMEKEAVGEVYRTVSAETTKQRDLLILESLRRGQLRGQVRPDADIHISHRLLVGGVTLDSISYDKTPQQIRSTVKTLVDIVLSGISPKPFLNGTS
jgi:AcrR family transcriptional regulator